MNPRSMPMTGRLRGCASRPIAQFEPVAVDLRLVIMIIKMNKDLERMADHAVNICESGLF